MQLQYVMLFGLAGHVHSGVVCYYVTWLGYCGSYWVLASLQGCPWEMIEFRLCNIMSRASSRHAVLRTELSEPLGIHEINQKPFEM